MTVRHRGGAVFLQGVENASFSRIRFDQLEGNGVFLSNHVKGSEIVDCDFWRTGDSAVLAVGSSSLNNGSSAEYPSQNTISRNYMDTVGVNMKQTSCYFKALTYDNLIQDNICFTGPRAGLNWNDGFLGGDLVEGNVIFDMVRETGDRKCSCSLSVLLASHEAAAQMAPSIAGIGGSGSSTARSPARLSGPALTA